MAPKADLTPLEEEAARRELVDIAQRIHRLGWVANHDGNITLRLGAGRILASPTALSKGDVTLERLIVIDEAGKKLEGTRRPFSESTLHLAAYNARPDVGAVIHAHPPFATAFAVSGVSLDPPFMPEAVVSLGPTIPTCDFALPFGEAGAAPLKAHLPGCDAFLLANHGVVAIGPDLETAYLRLELVEHLAKIKHYAMALGGPKALPPEVLAPLLAKRKKAGLGPEARGLPPLRLPWVPDMAASPGTASSQGPVSAGVGPCEGAPMVTREPSPGILSSQEALERLVADEIARVLSQGGA